MKLFSRTFWKKTFLGLALLLNFASFSLTFAQTTTTQRPDIVPSGTNQPLLIPHINNTDNQGTYLTNRLLPSIAATVIGLTGALSLVIVIVAGIFLLTAYANPEGAAAAKKAISYAVAGLIISGLSYAIVAIIASLNIPK